MFITMGRFVMAHWRHFAWQPWFDAGSPFENAYFPLTPLLVAAMAALGRISPAHALHLLGGLIYCAGPFFLFWFARELSGRIARALGGALAWSVCSPPILTPGMPADTLTWLGSDRLPRLVSMGETPHMLVVALLPLTLWLLARYLRQPDGRRFALVAIAAGAVMLANAFGIVVAVIAPALLLLAMMERRWKLASGAGAAVLAGYLLVSRFLPPSMLWLVSKNAPTVGGNYIPNTQDRIFEAAFLLGMAALTIGVRRLREPLTRFAVLFFAFFGSIVVAGSWGIGFLPQPRRFLPEMEMAACLLAAAIVEPLLRKSSIRGRIFAAATLSAVFLVFAVADYRSARRTVQRLDITKTVVYREARWIGQHLSGQRVMPAGINEYWFNLFTDNPQMGIGLEASDPNWMQRVAVYTIYTGHDAGSKDGEIAVLWLRAFGCGAITVAGPGSEDPTGAMVHPQKFDGILPLVWREGGDSIYQVPERSASLAHVVPESALVTRRPIHGLDVEQVRRYVDAIEDPRLPDAQLTWDNPERGRIVTEMRPGEVVSLQINYNPGWKAMAQGRPAPIRSDELGLTVIDPKCSGPCSIDLEYAGSAEHRALFAVSCIVALALLIALLLPLRLKGGAAPNKTANAS